jgi:two-component system OmpR family sensor kinase
MTGTVSLRGRLTLWFTILLIAMGLIGGIAAYLITRNDPDRLVDDQLRQIALNLGDLTGIVAGPARARIDRNDVVAVQVWDAAGHVLRVTPPGIALPRQAGTDFSEPTSGGERWRTYTLAGPERTIQVSQRLAVVQEIALGAAWQAIAPVLLLIPLSWLLVRLLVARILRPLDALARDLEDRAPDVRAPLAARGIPGEVAPLVAAVNATLARLAEALALQRRFVSDAAHQLRTPLTALRLQVGNLKRARPERDPDLLDDMEQGLRRMSTLTSQLLALARAEAASAAAEPGRADLAAAIDEAIAATGPLAATREIAIMAPPAADIEVAATSQELAVLFTNLIDNAVRYTTAGGRVEIRLEPGGDVVVVEICDTGPGLPEDMLGRVFERFIRHAEDGEGSGLGLAIVRAIADGVGARVSLRNRNGAGGLVARVELKAAASLFRRPGATADSQSDDLVPHSAVPAGSGSAIAEPAQKGARSVSA